MFFFNFDEKEVGCKRNETPWDLTPEKTPDITPGVQTFQMTHNFQRYFDKRGVNQVAVFNKQITKSRQVNNSFLCLAIQCTST